MISAFSGVWGAYPSYAPIWLSRDGGNTWTKEFTVWTPYSVNTAQGDVPDDQTFDYRKHLLSGNNQSTRCCSAAFSLAGGNNIYTGDIFDPTLVGNWAYYSLGSGNPTEQTNRLAISDGQADQPWMVLSRGTFSPIRRFKGLCRLQQFRDNWSRLPGMDSPDRTAEIGATAISERIHQTTGTALTAAYNPGHRARRRSSQWLGVQRVADLHQQLL